MEDVLKVVTLDGLFRVEQVEEFLHELWRHVSLELLNFDAFVDDKLKEELIDTLQVRPGRVHLLLLVNTCLCEVQVALLHARQGTEDVLFDHLHGLVHVGNNGAHCDFLVRKHGLELLDGVETLSLHTKIKNSPSVPDRFEFQEASFFLQAPPIWSLEGYTGETYFSLDVFLLVLVVVGLHAHLELLDVLLLRVFVYKQARIAQLAHAVNTKFRIGAPPITSFSGMIQHAGMTIRAAIEKAL